MKRDAIKDFDEQDRERSILRSVCGSRTKIARVLPFENPPTMPSMGTRRSTRVFVPKSVVKTGGSEAEVKVLRSGKRLLLESGLRVAGTYGDGGVELDDNGEDWFKLIENSGEAPGTVGNGGIKVRADGMNSVGSGGTIRNRSDLPLWRSFGSAENSSDRDVNPADSSSAHSGARDQALPVSCRETSELVGKPKSLDNHDEDIVRISAGEDRIYGITYTRKRRRIPASSQSETRATEDRMYGISFVRRQRRKSGATPELLRETQILQQTSSSIGSVGNNECVLASSNSDFLPRVVNQVTLVILVESSRSSSYYFLIFLVSILTRMTCSRVRMFNLATFLFLESIARVFSQQGIHFLPLFRQEKFDKNKTMHLPHPFQYLEERVVNAAHCDDAGVWCLKPDFLHVESFPQDIFSVDAPQHLSNPGITVIFGASRLVPLVSVNFAALPSFFMGLHSKMFLSFQYLPTHEHGVIRCCTSCKVLIEARGNLESFCQESSAHTEEDLSVKQITVSVCPALKRKKKGLTTRKGVFQCSPKVREPPNKRSHRGSTRTPGSSGMDFMGTMVTEVGWLPTVSQATKKMCSVDRVSGISYSENDGLAETSPSVVNGVESGKGSLDIFPAKFSMSGARDRSIRKKLNLSCKVSNTCAQLLETCSAEFADIGADGADASPDPNHKPRKLTRKSCSEKMKEMKLVLEELKQNIDSVFCKANILVIESDRCWREREAEVMLECSDSNDCWLAVKTGGMSRYLYKAQEMRPSSSNRYTHAMMWAGENGWKLEFCDRKDWIVFKELHRECCDRNLQAAPAKVIPVPGVCEVCDYECSSSVPFVRPSTYITVGDDEVVRALMSESANYDMDSGDEEWLRQLNSNSRDSGNDGLDYISEDNFEKIIYTFEKASYSHPDDQFDEGRVASLCMGLGGKNLVAAVYEYWLRKRKQKRKALVRVFQGPPPKRAQLIDKPFLRKKRSFKRQASQITKGKPKSFLAARAEQEAVCRVTEAKNAADKALEWAVTKRRKAQLLMQNSDLTTYKSVMALKIAEAVGKTEAFDAISLFFY